MEHLFDVWPVVWDRISRASHLLLLTDYDGTLTPIVPHPKLAHLSGVMRALLQEISRHTRITAGVISGRSLDDLKALVEVTGILYAGNHGLELETSSLRFVHPLAKDLKPLIVELQRKLEKDLASFQGVLVENKGFTLSVHYRRVATLEARNVRQIVVDTCHQPQFQDWICLRRGKKIYDLLPSITWDKGQVVSFLIDHPASWGGHSNGLLTLYLGDDLTDEHAFIATQASGGIAVFVGRKERKSTARYYLSSPREVEALLRHLASQAVTDGQITFD